MVRERLTRKQTTSRPDDVWPDMWKFVSDAVKGMYPAPHIHEHLATANCEPQPEPHCEQWHGHHKAHGRVQCAVLSTPRTVC